MTLHRILFALVLLLFPWLIAPPAAAQNIIGGGGSGSGCAAGTACAPSTMSINGAINPAIDLGTAGTTRTGQILFETQANLAAQLLTNTGSDFVCRLSTLQPGGTFHDDTLVYGFNNNVPRVPLAGVWTFSGETDYCYNGVTSAPYSTHAFELNFIATTAAATQATVAGTAANGGTLTLTATGAFTGSPHSISVTAGAGDTISSLAESLASTLTSDTTFQAAGFYARANQTAGVLKIFNEVTGINSCSALAYNPSCNVAWTKTTTGTATLAIAQAATITTRPMSLNFDRDNGPNGPNGLQAVAFTVGNCTGACAFTVFDSTATNNLLSVDGNSGYVTIGYASSGGNLLRFATTAAPEINMLNRTDLSLAFSDNNTHFTFNSSGDLLSFGTAGDMYLARNVAGTLRVASHGAGVSSHLVYYTDTGTTPTVANGATDCGTSPAFDSNSTDSAGHLTVGTSTNGGQCTVTFTHSWAKAPVCNVTDETTSLLVRSTPTTTAVVFTAAFTAGDKLGYICNSYGY